MMGRLYTEQVVARHGNGRYTIDLAEAPMYLQGYAPVRHKARFGNLCTVPKIPLHQLGWLAAANPAGLVAAGASIGLTVADPAIVSAAGLTAGTAAAGALTAGIGAGVAVLVAVIAGLWAAHEARVKGATQENQAINSAVQTFDAGIKAIFAAANSSDPTKNVSGPVAAQQVQQLFAQFFAEMGPYTTAPGTKDASGGGANCGSGTLNPAGPCMGTPGGHVCNSDCTATCCVGCQDLYPTMLQAVAVLNNPAGGSIQVCTVYGSKYGANLRSGYSLTYNPPAPPSPIASVAAGANTVLTDVVSALTGGAVPTSAPSSGSSWLVPAVIAALAAWWLL
jgi:hypothetical protein